MAVAISLGALSLLALSPAHAQDEEAPGEARGEYAWGEGGGSTGQTTREDPLRIQATIGAGAGARLVRNLDPPFQQDFLIPAYLDVGGAVYLPGAELRHGVSLGLSTNLMQDVASGVGAGQQWAITPSYTILIPFQRLLGMEMDLLQLQARIGIPLVFGASLGGGEGVDFTLGGELGLALHVKFLAGLGVYVEAQLDVIGGANDTVHPFLAFDGGLLWDYEVLP